MSKVLSTAFDPLGFGYGKAIFGSQSALVGTGNPLSIDKKPDQPASSPATTPPPSNATGGEGVITTQEAETLAQQKLFRSGSVFTSTLGDPITTAQLSGTRLQ